MVNEPLVATTDSWVIWYYIATYVIAIVALISLYLSIRSSKKVNEALLDIQNGLLSLTDPLVKIAGFSWIKEEGELSCENPPKGVMVAYQNMSNVPVLIEKSETEVFFGEKLLDDIVLTKTHKEDGFSLLAPGEVSQMGTLQNQMKKYLATPKDPLAPPNIIFYLLLEYRSVTTNKRFRYRSKKEILFSCDQPKLMGNSNIFEEHEEIF